MPTIQGIRFSASEQMPFSREEKHLWQMQNPLLQARHEGAGEEGYAVFGSPIACASPWFGVASCVGWTASAAYS